MHNTKYSLYYLPLRAPEKLFTIQIPKKPPTSEMRLMIETRPLVVSNHHAFDLHHTNRHKLQMKIQDLRESHEGASDL